MSEATFFSLNWLDFSKKSIVTKLSRAVRATDKLKSLNIPHAMVMETPVLDDAIAYAILKKERLVDMGDHGLFIGRVKGAMASLDFDEYWRFKEYRPILYLGSGNRKKFATL